MATTVSLPFTATSIGSNVIISGNPTTATIQIIAIYLQCGAATTLKFRAGTTDLTGSMTFATGGGFSMPNNAVAPYFECDNGDDFIIVLSGLVGSCGGIVYYQQF